MTAAGLRVGGTLLAACLAAGPAASQPAETKATSPHITATQLAPPVSPTVEVFTNSAIYVRNTQGAAVYLLDGLDRLADELSQGLPGDEKQAMVIVQQRIARMGTAELKRRSNNAAEGIAKAAQYRVDRVPAVVLDGNAVIYGEPDVAAAVAKYRAAQGVRK